MALGRELSILACSPKDGSYELGSGGVYELWNHLPKKDVPADAEFCTSGIIMQPVRFGNK